MSARRTCAKRQRQAQAAASAALHSTPSIRAVGHAACKALKPWPRPQPASSTRAPSGSGSADRKASRARAGVGKNGASVQARKG
jgi:hypothetical protein